MTSGVFHYTTLQGGIVTKRELEQAKQDIDIRTFRQGLKALLKIMLVNLLQFPPVEVSKIIS